MDKKLVKIVIGIFIFIIIVLIMWYFLFLKTNVDTSVIEGTQNSVGDSPFGLGSDVDVLPGTGINTNTDLNTSNNQFVEDVYMRQISDKPVSGATFLVSTSTNETLIRYVVRGTGHIFETSPKSVTQRRVTNTTIPMVREAVWLNNGSNVILRYLNESDEIQSFYGSLPVLSSVTSELNTTLDGVFLPNNIQKLVASPDGEQIFYLIDTDDGVAGILADANNTNSKTIFEFPVNELQVSWPSESTITITTNASVGVLGYVYTLNTETGKLTHIIEKTKALTTLLSPNLYTMLISENRGATNSILAFSGYDIKNKTKKSFNEVLNLTTLPEKCVWDKTNTAVAYCAIPARIPISEYPDKWYQGIIDFEDIVWQIDTETDDSSLIFETHYARAPVGDTEVGPLDLINPVIDDVGEYILFNDKNDLSLWMLKLPSK